MSIDPLISAYLIFAFIVFLTTITINTPKGPPHDPI